MISSDRSGTSCASTPAPRTLAGPESSDRPTCKWQRIEPFSLAIVRWLIGCGAIVFGGLVAAWGDEPIGSPADPASTAARSTTAGAPAVAEPVSSDSASSEPDWYVETRAGAADPQRVPIMVEAASQAECDRRFADGVRRAVIEAARAVANRVRPEAAETLERISSAEAMRWIDGEYDERRTVELAAGTRHRRYGRLEFDTSFERWALDEVRRSDQQFRLQVWGLMLLAVVVILATVRQRRRRFGNGDRSAEEVLRQRGRASE
ncbi:MAG TPA: hypothetical protein PLI18_13455 [Pirellulaceae bacterium]|nr:hypothetical protein [Pirellulaceae bacterium]